MPKLSQKNRKMLIIGGTGFIGYHLAKELLGNSNEVVEYLIPNLNSTPKRIEI